MTPENKNRNDPTDILQLSTSKGDRDLWGGNPLDRIAGIAIF